MNSLNIRFPLNGQFRPVNATTTEGLTVDILCVPCVMCADLKDYQLDSSLTTNVENRTRVV
jgi:hypothetical protein